jgi:hypothetical protein
MLREGQYYFFGVEKEITAPDNKRYFVLKSPDNRKLLLPSEQYSFYNISPGKRIKCRVDKINCKGEIYLEPKNPHYDEGKSYFFKITGIDSRTDNSGREVSVFIVNDRYEREIAIPVEAHSGKPGRRIRLVVERISKGKLYLLPDAGSTNIIALDAGQSYKFKVEKIAKGIDNEDYFVITDPNGNYHTLRRRYYDYYRLEPGKSFTGRVVKFKDSGEKIIEPVNPFYKEGDILRMKISSVERNFINGTFTLELTDKYNHNHCIETDQKPAKYNILCKVVRIKKGWPVIELL